MAFLGIDGGGTKTTIALVDSDGTFIAKYDGGPSNPQSTKVADVETTLLTLVDAVQNKHPELFGRIKSVFAGIAGSENKPARTRLQNTLSEAFESSVKVKVYNDALTALYSGTGGEPGIVNICGTGSITYGQTKSRKEIRIGGWGYLTDHNGSGYGIGRLGIKKAFEAFDGLIGRTELTDLIFKRFSIEAPSELIPLIYEPTNGRALIASCCEDVFEAFLLGDEAAREIIMVACRDMCRNITGMIRHYFSDEERVKVVLAGSVYKRIDDIQPFLEQQLSDDVRLIVPKLPPVAGALIAAFRNSEDDACQTFANQLEKTFL